MVPLSVTRPTAGLTPAGESAPARGGAPPLFSWHAPRSASTGIMSIEWQGPTRSNGNEKMTRRRRSQLKWRRRLWRHGGIDVLRRACGSFSSESSC
jgi:hypothetical protein